MDFNIQIGPEVDREQLVEEIIRLNALISGLIESVPGTFIVLDSQWRLACIKGDLAKTMIDDERSLLGKPLDEIFPKDYNYFISREVIEPLLHGNDTAVIKYSNKLHKWFKVSAYESNRAIFIRLEDVTAEQTIYRLMRLNQFSVDWAMDLVFWILPGGNIINANAAAYSALKYSKEKLVKMKISDIDPSFIDPKWHKFVKDLKQAGSRTYESSLQALDGTVIPVEVSCSYVTYSGSEYIIAYARDITNRKKAEKALLETKTEAELYVDLMGHDINNMNQVALGYLELALDKMRTEGGIDNADAELIAKPYEMLLNSSRLIENVKKIQREKAGGYRSDIVNVGSVLREVRDSFADISGRDITVELNPDGECRVAANELLKDVFINLVGNSIKHSKGPLRVNIDMKRVAEDGRSYCRVSVEDNGPGIADDMKKKLLDRLSAENTRARGKGLGLYLIKQLVYDFHGKFWMEDRVTGDYTKGVRFVVMLPIAE